jgi:alkane 1-monooxygenase
MRRLARQGRGPLTHRNRLLQYLALQLAGVAALGVAFGLAALPYWLLQSLVAIVLLEVVNYIEHYGLLRRRRGVRYAPVQVWHSWNSSNWLTNRFLFNLQRHSDHHYRPGRRYQNLRHHAASPQLPTGYAGMILLALVPPLWHRMMDRRVLQALRRPDA